MSANPLNPTQHPELELIQQLWMSGLRAKQIIAHLEANGLPPIKEEALARYGQRNWNHLYKMEIGEELKINTITNMMDALADEGLTVTKVSIQKNESLGWERDEEGVNHQVLKPSVKQTLEVRPNPTLQLEKATLAPIKITPLKGVNRLPQKADNLKTAVSIPDIQVGYFRTKTGELISLHDEAAVNVTLKMLQYLEASEHIDLIVLQGDNLDFPEFSSHRSAPGFIGNLQYAIDRYATILYAIRQICPTAEIVHLNGNHECLSTEAQAITPEGPKDYVDLSVGDLVLSANDDLEPIWLPIEEIYEKDFDGELIQIGSNHSRSKLTVTPGHRVVGLSANNKNKWTEHLASEYATKFIPTATKAQDREELDILDDEIRLAAWCLTDSYRNNQGNWYFYQSGEKVCKIIEILDNLDISYASSIRKTPPTEICGKVLKSCQDSYNISINKADSKIIDNLVDKKYALPSWVWELSDRQLRILIKEWQFTDGTTPTRGTSIPIYCSSDLRKDLQMLLIQRGYSATLHEYNPGHWRINIVENKTTTKVEKHLVKKVPYKGKVWCLKVENERFFAYEDGKPTLTGNCRLINTAVDKMPGLAGLSRAGETKPLLGIEYLCRFDDVNVTHIEDYPNGVHWANEGLRFIHGSAVSAAKGATSAKQLSLGVSTVAGHGHRAELVWDRRMTKDGALQIFAGSAGTLAKINGEIPSSKTGVNPSGGLPYRKGTETWQQGIMIIHYEHEGFNAYPHIVPINEGEAYLHGKRFQSSVDSNGCDL